jgi:hypothetical protein
VLGCAILLTTVGCAVQAGAPDSVDGPTAPPVAHSLAATSAPAASSSPSGRPASPPPASATPSTAVSPQVAADHTCAARDLVASNGPRTGQFRENGEDKPVTIILLRNTGHSRCLLNGWPGLLFYGYAFVAPCPSGQPGLCALPEASPAEQRPFRVIRSRSRAASDVVLAPGETTSFSLLWLSSYAGTCIDRGTQAPYRAEIRVPGDSHPIPLVLPDLQPCDVIEVTPFGSSV